uniref:STAS domain-containing protein n=1 Tax=Nonomuraea gerenzanensis TaxID=93944 RepID=A0A1M4EGA4_9ACTN|nr:hypothetical protein BN4615_P7356 [Nonomuraea gerenzanensis]
MLVSVRGEADLTNAARLESEVRRHLVPGEPLVLDLSLLTFMDSNGLRALENLDAVVHAQGGTLHLAGVHGIAARLLQVTGVWSRLDIHSGVAGAVRRALGRDAAPA